VQHATQLSNHIPTVYAYLSTAYPSNEQIRPPHITPCIHGCQPPIQHHTTSSCAGHSAWQTVCPARACTPALHWRDRKLVSTCAEISRSISPEQNPLPLYPLHHRVSYWLHRSHTHIV